jgi:D-inositol-3-phosphate glycosyltransferase
MLANTLSDPVNATDCAVCAVDVALLTGCQDRPYAFGLAMALADQGVNLDIIGSDDVDSPEFHSSANIKFLNLLGGKRGLSFAKRVLNVLLYYARLLRYTATAKPKIFHILWNNKFEYFDRTLLMLYYRACGKRMTLTAHNVNTARRDNHDSFLNRLTLRIQYRLTSHIFVHTEKMKAELMSDFGVPASAVTVLVHPINDAFPNTALTPAEAKKRLGLDKADRTMLFFGRLQPYKGLEHLLSAFERLADGEANWKLIIAGEPKKGYEAYEAQILNAIAPVRDKVIPRLEFIPDNDAELYLKAADVMVLPYKDIFQSGVLFLGLSFGLPVVVSDVGSFRETIRDGVNGFLYDPADPGNLDACLKRYFESDLYRDLGRRRSEIRKQTFANHSWKAVATLTLNAFRAVA